MKMTNWKKQIKTCISAIMICIMLMTVFPVWTVQAAAAPSCAKSQTVYCYAKDESFGGVKGQYTIFDFPSCYIYIKNLASNAKITRVKSSNSKIKATSSLGDRFNDTKAICLEASQKVMLGEKYIKNGEKAKITFNVVQNGKTYKLACNITMKESKSPVQKLVIGKKNYASAFKGIKSITVTFPKSNFKLTADRATGFVIDYYDVFYKSGIYKKVKDGTVINGKDVQTINVIYHVTKKQIPANYSSTKKWVGKVPSPLHGEVTLHVEY